MIGTIFLYALAGVTVAAAVDIGYYLFAVLLVGVLVYSCKHKLDAARNLRPSVMVCPNCRSQQIKIENRIEGYVGNGNTQIQRSLVLPKYRKTVNSQYDSRYNRQRVGVCQSCGFDYPWVTPEEAQLARDKIRASVILGILAAVFCAYVGLAE